MAAAYRELSQEELARLRAIGEQGKRARDAGAAHTFGETGHDSIRRTNTRRRQLAIESLAEAPSVRPSLYSAKEIAVVTGSAQDLLAAAQPSSLALRLGSLKQDLMLQASAGRLRHQRDTDELVKLIDAQAAGPFVAAHRISHYLRERGCEVVPERAFGKHRVFSWSPCQVPVRVARALSIQSRPTHMLLQALSKKWSEWCSIVDYSPSARFDDERASAQAEQTLCNQAGMCICDNHGQVMQRCQAALSRVMKKMAPAKSATRTMLTNSDLLLLLMGQEKPPDLAEEDIWFADAV